jgi:hypothetical protein
MNNLFLFIAYQVPLQQLFIVVNRVLINHGLILPMVLLYGHSMAHMLTLLVVTMDFHLQICLRL